MAGGSFLTLLDDITSVLDDVASMTKVAAKKTVGVVGDDLALNAQQVAGVNAERELPIVWAVAKGSFWNKVKIIPLALALSAISPLLVTGALLIGGTYLCYEGAEKIFEKFFQQQQKNQDYRQPNISEEEKIKGAIKTDFILSGEILVISLGSAATLPFLGQITVLATIGLLMTIGVYGLVAVIVKTDDIGLFLTQLDKNNFLKKFAEVQVSRKKRNKNLLVKIWRVISLQTTRLTILLLKNGLGIKILNISGQMMVNMMPKFMKLLTILGTLAMFMVGGGIFTHALQERGIWTELLQLPWLPTNLEKICLDLLVGLLVGAITVIILEFAKKIYFKFK